MEGIITTPLVDVTAMLLTWNYSCPLYEPSLLDLLLMTWKFTLGVLLQIWNELELGIHLNKFQVESYNCEECQAINTFPKYGL